MTFISPATRKVKSKIVFVTSNHDMMTYAERRYGSTRFQSQHQTELSGQLHASGALHSGKEYIVNSVK